MDNNRWQGFLLPYKQAVDELILKFNAIKKQKRYLGEVCPIESVDGRVKSVPSILEKMDKYNLSYDEVEGGILDIAGIRIICQFVDDIYEVVNMIHERDGIDLQILKIKNYLQGEDKSILKSGKGRPKESGYQSYHLIVKYPVLTSFGMKEVNVEIQIRTLAMNFWAVIEHSMKYKYKENLPEVLRNRLVSMAENVSQIDDEMNDMRDEIISAQQFFRLKSVTINDIKDNLGLLRELGYDDQADEYEEIFRDLTEQNSELRMILLSKEIKNELGRLLGESQI